MISCVTIKLRAGFSFAEPSHAHFLFFLPSHSRPWQQRPGCHQRWLAVIRSYGAMHTGIGTAPAAGARQVFHVTLPPQKGRRFRAAGYVEKRIPAEPWRGQRVRLSLLLKNQGGMNPWVTVAVRDTDTNGILSRPQGNSDGGDA